MDPATRGHGGIREGCDHWHGLVSDSLIHGLHRTLTFRRARPQYKAAADVEVPCPAYTGSFYPDGSRKKGTFKAHVGVPPLAIEAAFANADYHEHHSRRDTWPARSEYEGDWMRNMRCGYGTMKWKWDGKHKDAQNHPVRRALCNSAIVWMNVSM